MDKKFLINEIHSLIESKQLWEEMGEHIFALGGDIFATKYVEAYNYHESLVFKLIQKYRGYEEVGDEFEFFTDSIYDLSQKRNIKFVEEDPGEEPKTYIISNAEELLDCILRWPPTLTDFS